MHYGGDIPYFLPFRNALRSITEVTTPLFCTSLRTGLIKILIKLLKILQVVFIESVYFFSFLFHENQPCTLFAAVYCTAANIVQIRGALRK